MPEPQQLKPKRESTRGNFRRTQGPQTSKKNKKSNHNPTHAHHDEEEDNVCVICAEHSELAAITPCNHRTCHKCSFRQLALYGKRHCLICRTENDKVLFTTYTHDNYNDVMETNASSLIFNEKYQINFTSNKVEEMTLNLLKYNCTLCKDDNEYKDHDFGSFKRYNEHLKNLHERTICMICATHKFAFPSELKIYTQKQLKNHQSRGDYEGFKGHPMCGFCSGRRFYSDDELYLHMREKHEKCHICDRLDSSQPQYFKDYHQLFEHFKTAHYACTVQTCLDAKFVVFADELELQAHILKEHGDLIRGKPKFFQSELSTFISTPSRVVRDNNSYQTNTDNVQSLYGNRSTSNSMTRESSNETPEMKQIRLEERAKHYLDNSMEDFETFKSFNKDYDKNRITAIELLNTYKTIFTSTEADVYLLVHNLSETYPTTSKKYHELDTIYVSHEQEMQRKRDLPSLTDDAFKPIVRGMWGNNSANVNTVTHGTSSNSSSNSRTDLSKLPTLQTPKNNDPFRSSYQVKNPRNNQPVMKSAVKQTLPSLMSSTARSNKTTPITVSNSSSRSSSHISDSMDLSLTPAVNTTNQSLSFAPNNLERVENRAVGNVSTGQLSLKNLKLESLPKPKPKFVPPPLEEKKLPDPKNWRKQEGSKSTNNELDDMFNGLLVSKSKSGKKKNKQKQLLFHIGA